MLQPAFFAFSNEIQFLYPKPQSKMLAKETVLILRFDQIKANEITNLHSFLTVIGSKSGFVEGEVVICTDRKTINFKPKQYFLPGEHVTVTMRPSKSGKTILDSTFIFEVSKIQQIPTHIIDRRKKNRPQSLEKSSLPKFSNGQDPLVINGVSVPADFPEVEITINDNPDDGLIFLTNIRYSLIFDNEGNPVWYWPIESEPLNLKVQHGLMTVNIWEDIWDGPVGFDSTYTIVKKFEIPDGYWFDDHELKLTDNGNYLLIVNDEQQMDLTHLGGQAGTWVLGNHVAEMDANDNLVFFWRSWDYFDVADAIHEDPRWGFIDYIHMNTIEIDLDGHIIISSRHLSEITKINRQSGDIIWRLGGENDDFTWVNDSYRNQYQHDIRVLANGNLTLFDNGNHRNPDFSRALELSLDTNNWEVTKVWEFRDDPDRFTPFMGNIQRFPNGNTGICWAVDPNPKLTEVRPDGSKAFELDYKNEGWAYKAHRYPWNGKATVPYLVVESYLDRLTLIFNKFGDPDVQEYNVYGGMDPLPTNLLTTTTEPFVHLTELSNQETWYFRVTAVNSGGQESGYSNEEQTYVRFVSPGENMVFNGDFSEGLDFWEWEVDWGDADANIYVTQQNELCFEIFEFGFNVWQISAWYEGLTLEQGKNYLFEFDAYASGSRSFEAEVYQNWENLSQIGYTALSENKTHYSHQFFMEESALDARIVLNTGGNSTDVYVDNVSLKEVVTAVEEPGNLPAAFRLNQNYPNPFNPRTIINYELPITNYVNLDIYNSLGQNVVTLVSGRMESGSHQLVWDASGFASGIYYYRIEAGEFVEVKKMVLLR
jgi:hypothetical protein